MSSGHTCSVDLLQSIAQITNTRRTRNGRKTFLIAKIQPVFWTFLVQNTLRHASPDSVALRRILAILVLQHIPYALDTSRASSSRSCMRNGE